jgi:N-acetylmuramic acid 6-phosphate etherase
LAISRPIIQTPISLKRISGALLKSPIVTHAKNDIGAKLSFPIFAAKRIIPGMRERLYLGIEGGASKTTVLVTAEDLRIVHRASFGPGNFRLLDPRSLENLFRRIAAVEKNVSAVGIGLAGIRDDSDRKTVRQIGRHVWGELPLVVTNDLQIALAAAPFQSETRARVLVLSGTGSCCYGEDINGKSAKVGGWGHVLGDLGSGYDIALRALKAAIYDYDRPGRWGVLGRNLLRALLLNSPADLITWVQSSDKAQIARLAPIVFESKRDPIVPRILSDVAAQLADDALNCARRLAREKERLSFVFAGSVLRKQPAFAHKVGRLIQQKWRGASIQTTCDDGALGAAKLAIEFSRRGGQEAQISRSAPRKSLTGYTPAFDPETSPTEQRNPQSSKLDKLSIQASIDLMLRAESAVVQALLKQKKQIERAIHLVSDSLKSGGHLFYVGAGTSGRLGVLDASECPPTFRASPEMVQGIIAGGQTALWQAVEGAEDDWEGGAACIRFRQLTKRDTLVGIAASGRTPFVWGAFAEARKRGSRTIFLCFNPSLKIDRKHRPDVVIVPNLGPEILTGSTRLKCGTATKLVLNMISTISMVRLGKVMSNLMIDLNPSNIKLRDRAVRIVRELTNCSTNEAADVLEKQKWIVKEAVAAVRRHQESKHK